MVEAGPRYRKLNRFLRDAFGERVYKVGLRGEFTCPNRDGTKGRGGCTFCNPLSNGPVGHFDGMSLYEQLSWGVEYVGRRHDAQKFIAFFSDYSTTYGDIGDLERLYREAADHPAVVGLALGTRPDCLSAEVLDLLERLARTTFLWVELGVQSAHDRTLERVHRCHTVDDTRRAVAELRARDIAVSAHVILGLPGESASDMLASAGFLAKTGVHGVKIHNLHVVEGTPLADMHLEGRFEPLRLDEYVELAVRFLEHLPPDVVIQRLSGEAPRHLTVAPAWSVNKLAVLNAIERGLEERDGWQGKALGHGREELRLPAAVPGATASGYSPSQPR